MQREGMTFRQFMVADSLCCSSRATILTGAFPHNTRVLGNTRPAGGYWAFRRYGARRRSVGDRAPARRLPNRADGEVPQRLPAVSAPARIPAGTSGSDRAAATAASATSMSDNGRAVIAGHRPRDYMTDVLARRAARFIRRSAGRQPFFITSPPTRRMRRTTPAPRHRRMFRPPAAPAWRRRSTRRAADPPTWLGRRPPLRRAALMRSCSERYRCAHGRCRRSTS